MPGGAPWVRKCWMRLGNGDDGAEGEVGAAAKANDFALDAILLVGEGEHHEGGGEEVIIGAGGEVEALIATPQLDVINGERGGVGGSAGVFTGAKKEVKSDGGHVGSGEGGLLEPASARARR